MIKLELSDQLVTVILEALAALPLARSFEAFVTVRDQLIAQKTQTPAAPPPPKDTGGIAHQSNGDARE